jgi:PAS domain S-box-containing protein
MIPAYRSKYKFLPIEGKEMKNDDSAAKLTSRETTLLSLASEGHTDKSTAETLGISQSTVESHWVRIRLKLGASSRTEAVAICLEGRNAELEAHDQLLETEIAERELEGTSLRHIQEDLEQRLQEGTADLALANETILGEISAREKALLALKESEARFRGIIENSAAGYFLVDLQGIFQYVNGAWLRLHKYDSPAEVVGRPFSITQVPEDMARATGVVEAAIIGSTFQEGEFTRRCRDGSTGWHTYTVTPVLQGGEIVGLEGFIIDTTERKRAEEVITDQLDELRRWFRAMLGREERVRELKAEVNEACRRSGEPIRYPSEDVGLTDSELIEAPSVEGVL